MTHPSSRPNVLVIVADDHQYDAVGALGHPTVRTPALDDLVAKGTTFTNAHYMGGLTPAVCSPSRACLLSGMYVFRAAEKWKLTDSADFVRLAPTQPTLPEIFRRAGYETFVAGKWHNDIASLLRSFEGGSRIFHGGMCDHTRVPVRELADFTAGAPPSVIEGFSSDLFCQAIEQFARSRSRDRPFFAWLALTSPHDPRTPPDNFAGMYDPARMTLPPNFKPAHPFDNGALMERDEQLATRPLQSAELGRHLASYYGMISHHDAQLGRLMNTLRATRDADNTIVVYLSDHGLALGRHGLLGKQNLYEHSVRVPMIMAGPGIPASRRCGDLVQSLDLFRTLCSLAGVPVQDEVDSRDLQPLLSDHGSLVRDSLFAIYKDVQRMVNDGRWKLIVYHIAGRRRLQLFDLRADPDELHDLSGDPAQAATIARLQSRLRLWQTQTGDPWVQFSEPVVNS